MRVLSVLFAVVVIVGLPAVSDAQYFDNFDSYVAGTGIIGQGGWEGWDGGVGTDATVTTAQAHSPANSLNVAPGADVVQVFSGINAGVWYAKAQTYIPANHLGETYFIMNNTYAHGGPYNWSVQVLFSGTNGTVESQMAQSGTATLLTDQWVEILVEIDLDTNDSTLYYNGVQFATGAWYTDGINEIQSFDLFCNGCSDSYYDDVYLDTVVPVELQSLNVE